MIGSTAFGLIWRRGKPQNEIKTTGKESFATIDEDPERLRQFTEAMASVQIGAFAALALTREAFHGEWSYTLAPRHKVT
jgi:hypothetical protein